MAGSPDDFDRLIKIDAPESGRNQYLIGDLYRFGLYGLNGSQNLLATLIDSLKALPFSAVRDDPAMPFRRNLELEALHDAFSNRPVGHVRQLTPYTQEDLDRECRFWQNAPIFKMQLLSPARLLKDKQARQRLKGEPRYCRQAADLSADLAANRLYDNFAALLARQTEPGLPARTQPAALTLDQSSHLFWLNNHYTDADGKSHAIGGMAGEIVLSVGSADFDWTLWVLGQYTGFGQRSAFGFGRYRLQTPDGAASFNRIAPAASLITAVGAAGNLAAAYQHIQNNSRRPGEAEPGENDEDALFERLRDDVGKLLDGRFFPPPLQGFIIKEPGAAPRPLAVPPFRDRVLQRAVAQVLQPAADALQYRHSYGFRPGRSRLDARYAIQSAWREGYRWVYESDIDDFFDSVAWPRLEVRLRALWGDDPLVDALCRWMQAPVEFQGQTVRRVQGLPQGAPLSPLLANIMLDDFDNDMRDAGFKLVRFADDFVVLCKSREQAELAHRAAELSLQEHGLSLNDGKTRIARMDDGFYYLGYLFVNDMALESPNRLRAGDAARALSAHSWLNRFVAREIKALAVPELKPLPAGQPPSVPPEPTSAAVAAGPAQNVPNGATFPASSQETNEIAPAAQQFGERDRYGMLLCVTGDCAVIRSLDERILIERGEQSVYDAPWRQLHAVLVLGRHNITTPALTAAMEFNVPVHFASATGKYRGVSWNGQTGAQGSALWLKQQQAFADPPARCR